MRYCNNCGNKIENHVNFCTECGVKIGTVIEDKEVVQDPQDNRNIHSQKFSYNDIDIDLRDLRARHGKNKIKAIKELRQRYELSLSDTKEIIDRFYVEDPDKSNYIHVENNSKGCLNILLWILFLPILLIKRIIDSNKFNKKIKILLIIGSVIVSMPYIVSYIAILTTKPQLILIGIVISLIYRNKKKRESKTRESRLIKEERDKVERERKDRIVKQTLDIIFKNKEMSMRLKEFVLQHTKKYDNEQIDYNDYLRKVDLFLVYINRKTNLEIKMSKDNYTNEIIEYWNKDDVIIEREMIEKYIEIKKMRIYLDDMKKIINVHDYEKLEDIVKEYIDIFGENALKELNLIIFSNSLEETYDDIYNLVKAEYDEIKKEHEMRKLEGELFKSDATLKGMEYIDTLSGFEFEDYLEELFTELGYTAKELPYSNDYGADLIISKGFNEIVIQAKNYSTNVGNKAVQEVIAAKSYYKCDIGMVITNSYYTQNAVKTAEASEIILIDRDGLERIIDEGSIYFSTLISEM